MQIAKIILLLIALFVLLGMGWIVQRPLPKPDAPEIKIIAVRCTNGQTVR